MKRDGCVTVEERARITEIQDSLIERYVEQREAIQEGNNCRAIRLEFEIKELLRKKGRNRALGSSLIGRSAICPARAVVKEQSDGGTGVNAE